MSAHRITRRGALKFASLIMAAAAGRLALPNQPVRPPARGYGTDPDRLKREVTWDRTLSPVELATLAVLGEIILPAESPYPSARSIGVHHFLDEWLSAPYPPMQADRTAILEGLRNLDDDTRKRVGTEFRNAPPAEQLAVFEASCSSGDDKRGAFVGRLIELVCGGYYSTREGLAAIGYVGNVALESFPARPAEVIGHFEEVLSTLSAIPIKPRDR
jgi:hypothetical protein